MSTDRKLFDLLDLAIAGNYPTWSACGDALWRIISRAPHRTDRVQLVAHLLVNFDPQKNRSGSIKRVPGTGLSDAQYNPLRPY